MKIKLTLGLLVTALLSTNSIAMQITNGKFVSHKEFVKGHLTASFGEANTEVTHARLQYFKDKIHQQRAALTGSVGYVYNNSYVAYDEGAVIGTVNTPTTIPAHHSIHIENVTDHSQTYKISTLVDTCFFGNNTSCQGELAESEDIVIINAHGSFSLDRYPVITRTYDTPGQGFTGIETDIEIVGTAHSFVYESENKLFTIAAATK